MLLTKSLQGNMVRSIHKYVQLRSKYDQDWPLSRFSEADLDAWIKDKFSFVSMNAGNMLKQIGKASEGTGADEFDASLERKIGEILRMANLDGKLLIVDEAHNLFRAITNGSKNALGLYDLVMRAKDLKVFFLTGTPIANDPFELVPCFNMLGSKRPNIITLPEEYTDFYKLYVGPDGEIKNRAKFQNRIFGLVSKVDHLSAPGKGVGASQGAGINVEFPKLNAIMVERVNMDDDQYMRYRHARDKELQEAGGKGFAPGQYRERHVQHPAMMKPKSDMVSSYRVRSRQLGNYCPPKVGDGEAVPAIAAIPPGQLESPKFRKIALNVDARPGQLGLVYSQFTGIGGLGTFAAYLRSRGWSQFNEIVSGGDGDEAGASTPPLSPRAMARIGGSDGPALPGVEEYLHNIQEEGSKLSRYKGSKTHAWWIDGGDDRPDTGETVNMGDTDEFNIADALEGAPTLEPADVAAARTGPTFAIICGDVPVEERARIEKVFTSKDNIHGALISLLLVSSTGAEGLDLKCIRHIHVMEPYWNWGRIAQIISRGVRNDSHVMLPPEEKNVTAFIYLAVPPKSEQKPDGEYPETTDTELYEESLKNQVGITSFIDAINETAIECPVNGGENCRMCAPTNAVLFTDDPMRDAKMTDQCTALVETRVKADEITVDGVQYYYVDNPNSAFDYTVLIHDATVDGYRPMPESHEAFQSVISAIVARRNV
jgi:hypothetical protein